jgi:hypothetical protein
MKLGIVILREECIAALGASYQPENHRLTKALGVGEGIM